MPRRREAARAPSPTAHAAGVAHRVPPNGRMTTTATPSSSASGSRRFSASCSRGLSGSWTTSKRRVRSASLELAERTPAASSACTPMPVDATRRALLLEPRQVLAARRRGCAPARSRRGRSTRRCSVVLLASLLDARRPDLRRDDVVASRSPSSAAAERRLAPRRTSATSRRDRRPRVASTRRPTSRVRRRDRRTSATCRGRRPGPEPRALHVRLRPTRARRPRARA